MRFALRLLSVSFTLAALLAAIDARAQSGLQMTPDQRRVLVSKDVGAERWAITRDLSTGAVSGNVFFPGGGNPRFVWCDPTSSQTDPVDLACSGSESCLLAPCTSEAWAFLADVSLPASFFQPRGGGAALSCSATDRLRAQATSSPSGLQLAPNQSATLVSKDVGAERWAIARSADDGSVTGNVFYPGGGAPRFVYCRATGESGSNLSFSCDGADACGATCAASDWTFIADVTLPGAFFAPKGQAPIDELDARVKEALGDSGGFQASFLALDYGYSLEQVLRALSDGRLEATGLIRLRSGTVESPTEPRHGLFSETPQGALAGERSVRDVEDQMARWLGSSRSQSVCTAMLAMIDAGYSPEQIVTLFIVSPNYSIEFEYGVLVAVRDETGAIVVPELPAKHLVGPPSTLEPTPTPSRTPSPTPTPPPTCGNGRIDADEECDGPNLAGETCGKLGFGGGTLRCTARCSFDLTGCTDAPTPTPPSTPTPTPAEPRCNNGVKEASEACDGTDFGGLTCEDFGFASGQLRCTRSCTIDKSGCSDLCPAGTSAGATGCCGDGVAQSDEQCDGADLKGKTCASLGYAGGTLSCSPATCTLDASGCSSAPTPTPPVCAGDVCPDGTCVPRGADCCGGGEYCPAGKLCVGEHKCCPADLPDLCGNYCISDAQLCCGSFYCPSGTVCVSEGCCPAGQPQECPDGTCTIPGADCCGGGLSCIPGYHCVPGGCAPD